MSSGFKGCPVSSGLQPGRTGFTLAEAMVAGALLLLLGGALVSLTIDGFRIFLTGTTQAELEQTSAVVMTRLLGDLDRTDPGSLSFLSSPGSYSGLGLVPIDCITADSRQAYRNQLILYFLDLSSHVLTRRSYTTLPPALGLTLNAAVPLTLTAGQGDSLFADPGGTPTVLARDVSRFEVSPSGAGSGVALPLLVNLELSREVPRAGPQRFLVQRHYYPRNP